MKGSFVKNYFLSYLNKAKVVHSIHRQYFLFFIIGIFCFLIDISLLITFVEIFGCYVYFAISLSFIVATFVNYLLNIKFVFENGKHKKIYELTYFFLSAIIAFCLTLLLMFLFTDKFGLWYVISKIITVFIVSVFTFTIRKMFIFKN